MPPFAQSKPLTIETCQLDPPGPDEVLVRIRAASLCHSDLSVIDGSRPRPVPMVLGHEAAAEVLETGPGASEFTPGEKVVCVFIPSCGQCARCQDGRPALCEPGAAANLAGTLLNGGRRLRLNGEPIHHHLGVSGFAEYAVVSKTSLVKIDPEIPFEIAALFGCAVITGVGAALNTAHVEPGNSVAVVGAGGVGLSAIMGASLAGARQIVVVDVNPGKFDFARRLGATDAFDARQADVVAQVNEATGGGVDIALETAGVTAALNLAYQITRRGGLTVTAGLPSPQSRFSLSQVAFTAEERTLKGSFMGSCVPRRDIPKYVALYKQGRLPVDRLLTNRMPLAEINAGFDLLASGDAGRIVIQT